MGLLFFNEADVSPDEVASLSKTNGAAIPGQPCYILAAKNFSHNTLIWVNKQTFLIQRLQMGLGGATMRPTWTTPKSGRPLTAAKNGQAVTAADIAQFKAQMKMASQIKGTITETYQDIQTKRPHRPRSWRPCPPPPPQPRRRPRPRLGRAGERRKGARQQDSRWSQPARQLTHNFKCPVRLKKAFPRAAVCLSRGFC